MTPVMLPACWRSMGSKGKGENVKNFHFFDFCYELRACLQEEKN